jgi:hypothetical protein
MLPLGVIRAHGTGTFGTGDNCCGCKNENQGEYDPSGGQHTQRY